MVEKDSMFSLLKDTKPIRFTSYTTEPKYKIANIYEDFEALRDYLSHKRKLEKKCNSDVRVTFP